MLRLRSIFISDVHLGTRDVQSEHLLDFLRNTECEHLYLVGDLVDFWKARQRWYWPREHTAIAELVLEKARRGTRVVYVPGNHDDWLRDHAGSELNGVDIRQETSHETAQGLRLLITHGDEFDGAVRCNRLLATIGSGFYDVLLFLNRAWNRLRRKFGFPYWSLCSWLKRRVKNAVEYIERFEHAAVHEAARRGFDGIVCGHIHVPGLREIDGIRYANTGDWVEHCSALVETRSGELMLLRWAGEGAHRLGARGARPLANAA